MGFSAPLSSSISVTVPHALRPAVTDELVDVSPLLGGFDSEFGQLNVVDSPTEELEVTFFATAL